MSADAKKSGAEKLRRNGGDENVGGGDCVALAGYGDGGRDGKAGKKLSVFSGVENLAGKLGRVRPQRNVVASAAV